MNAAKSLGRTAYALTILNTLAYAVRLIGKSEEHVKPRISDDLI